MKNRIAKGIILFLIMLTALSLAVTAYAVETQVITTEVSSKVECDFKLVNSYDGNPPISLYYYGYKIYIKNESNNWLNMQVFCNVDGYSRKIITEGLPPFEECYIPITDYFSTEYLAGKNVTIEIKKDNSLKRISIFFLIMVVSSCIAALVLAHIGKKRESAKIYKL